MKVPFDWSFLFELAAAVLIAVLIRRFLFFLSVVKGRSMMNTLKNNDILLIRPRVRKLPDRGSIVICHYPGRMLQWPRPVKKFFRKFTGKHPAAGHFLAPFFKDFFHIRTCFVKRLVAVPGDTVEIRDGILLVNGEPADPPSSCATVFPALLVMPPRQLDAHECFVLGDNRMNSNDSRFIGPISDRMILGRAIRVMFPFFRNARL